MEIFSRTCTPLPAFALLAQTVIVSANAISAAGLRKGPESAALRAAAARNDDDIMIVLQRYGLNFPTSGLFHTLDIRYMYEVMYESISLYSILYTGNAEVYTIVHR